MKEHLLAALYKEISIAAEATELNQVCSFAQELLTIFKKYNYGDDENASK